MMSELLGLVDRILESDRRTRAYRRLCAAHGVELVQTYRHGPYKIVVLFHDDDGYETIEAQADRTQAWKQEMLDAWLDEELARQLGARMSAHEAPG